MSSRLTMWGLLFLLTANSVSATIINVPGDYATIQAGINAAINADTVLVQPGTYVENINYNGKNIILGSLTVTTGDTSYIRQTIIDGNESSSVVTITGAEDSTTVLYGFTITNGYSWDGDGINDGYGGGVCIRNYSAPVLDHLVIENNQSIHEGGGIFIELSNPIIRNSTISGNSACGIAIIALSNPVIEDCIISDNSDDWGAGIKISGDGGSIDITRTIINNNIASQHGGGIYASGTVANPSVVNVSNVSIIDNEAGIAGGGILGDMEAEINVVNSILWDNRPDQILQDHLTSIVSVDYSNVQAGFSGESIINSEPFFLDSYSLHPTSPCIDAGNPDFDGDGYYWAVDIDDQDNDGTRNDLGYRSFDQEDQNPDNHSIAFDGIDDFVIIPQEYGPANIGHERTLAAWIRPEDLSPRFNSSGEMGEIAYAIAITQQITASYSGAHWGGIGIELSENPRFLAVGYDGSPLYTVAAGVSTPKIGEWFHLALVFDGDEIQIFVNGIEEGSESFNGFFPVSTGGDAALVIGNHLANQEFNYTFPGLVDDVHLWNRALLPNEIRNLVSSNRSDSILVDLVGHWDLDEGTSTSVSDKSGSEYSTNGSISEAYWSDLNATSIDYPWTHYVAIIGSDETGDGSVGSPFATIQRGVDQANQNDTIRVGSGVYPDEFNINDKSLYIFGVDSTETIISTGKISIESSSTQTISMNKLQILSNGSAMSNMVEIDCQECSENDSLTFALKEVSVDGAGITKFLEMFRHVTFRANNSSFQNMQAGWYDGGVLSMGPSGINHVVEIENCDFHYNEANMGGAIYSETASHITIRDSRFSNHYSDIAYQGGGAICIRNGGILNITNSEFDNNRTDGDGGAIRILSSQLTVEYCQFYGNSSEGEGQVLYATGPSAVEIDFSSFSGNGVNPGALAISDGSSLTVSNSILWGTPNFQLVIPDIGDPCAADISYTDFSNSILGIDDQSGNLDLTWGTGNISQNPQFVSVSDLTVQATSPCIDAADPTHALDPDGTRADMGAFFYDQRDTIPPEIQLNFPELTAPVQNGDTLTITWTASDNTTLSWAKLFFTSDEGATFDLYDSVDADLGEMEWVAPDVISNLCNFALLVSDTAGNTSADTLNGTFSIDDGTLPTIRILNPTALTSVKEGDSLYVSWEASDNVGLDWFELWLSKNPSEDFVNLVMIPGDSTSFAFGIGHGVSDSARIKMTVMDVAHNLAEDYSDYFSITDNTAPVISFLGIPDTVEWGIGSVLDLWVIASDNVEVTGLDLSYSADEGATWLPIIEDLYPVQGRPTYSWLIPNTPGDCQVRAVVSDAVGLTDTSYSEEFSIIVEYPQLVASLPEIRPDGDLSLAFSQPIDSLNFSTAASVTGSVFGEYEISGELNGVYATISVPNGFVSLDTLRLVLFASEWTNRYGYGLDGNGDGAFDGNGADNDTIYFTVNAAGDYNQDDALDFEDFDDFITAWHHDVVDYELAPHQGTIPHISIQPDSSFDIYDLATFASMWNWAAGMSPSAPMTETFPYETFTTEQNGNTLSISVPQADYRASQTIIKYDPNLVAINLTDPGLAKVSSSALSFVDVNPDSGYILITSSQLNEIEDELLNFTLIPSTRHRYSIEIAFQGSNGADNPIQKRSVVELLPIPTSFSLWQNYPNPFNASTSIEYALPMNTELNISIYDIRGRFVRDIYSGEKPAGYHLTQWNGTTDAGQNVASGVYFIVLQTPEYIGTEKLLLLK